MTWLLVCTSLSGLITMPVPAAASLSYRGVVLVIARPGLTPGDDGLLAAGQLCVNQLHFPVAGDGPHLLSSGIWPVNPAGPLAGKPTQALAA